MAKPSEFRGTLNLPRTGFPMKADLVRKEPEQLERWERMKLYEQLRRVRRGARRFVLHDGPPYSNGASHLGHLMNNALKDTVIRYKFLRGHDVPFVPGWDCHGQPIEHQYLKTTGLAQRDVDPLTLRRSCAEYAMKWVRQQREERKRLGALGDWERPYTTMDRDLEAAEIEAVGRMIRDGYIFRGKKAVIWCATCETALADNAVEYQPHVSRSVYVRFRVTAWPEPLREATANLGKPVYAVIWTTTPWTLPANVAVAFSPKLTYDVIDAGAEALLLARELAPGVLQAAGLPQGGVLASAEGRALEGLACAHPFVDRESRGILADYVSAKAGTGIVHTAPGHGEEDFASGMAYRLPVLSPVDGRGRFTEEVPRFAGQMVFDANRGIIDLLREGGSLVHETVIDHSYPFCWRCKNPVIFRATEQWFISLDHRQLKRRAVEAARRVVWHPGSGAERMAGMVEQRPDWCISRQRSWGVPIPVFYCEACHEPLATEASLAAIRDWVAQEGADVWWTRDAAGLLPADTRCTACGGQDFRKETDTLDVWFDSGVTHTSVLRAREFLGAPADLYCEAIDQFRGWFQSSLLTSVALYDQPPYREVLAHGWVVGAQGEKLSKSLGNAMTLTEAAGKWGADVMRLWVLSEDFHEEMTISPEIMDRVTEAYRKLRNTLRYLLGNLGDLPAAAPDPGPGRVVESWMRWRLGVVIREVTADMDRYAFHHAVQKLLRFCTVDLSAFYLDLLKDRLYASRADDPARRAAQRVLAETFSALVRMLAPVLPFTAEEAWGHAPEGLRGGTASVHLADWPEVPSQAADGKAADDWGRFMALRERVMRGLEAARQDGTVAAPLEAEVVVQADGAWREWADRLAPDLAELLIVSGARVEGLDAEGGEALPGLAGRVRVRIGKASGTKCERCWLVRPSVGRDERRPTLCGRCAEAVDAR